MMINTHLADIQKITIVKAAKKLGKIKKSKPTLSILDTIIATCIVGPLVIFFWRGAWDLMCEYEEQLPQIPTLIISWIIQLIFAFTRETLQKLFEKKKDGRAGVVAQIVRRIYTYVFVVLCVMHWRSTSDLMDFYLGVECNEEGDVIGGNLKALFSLSFVSLMLLIYSRTLVNMMDAPYCIVLDRDEEAFDFPTRFQIKVSLFVYKILS